MSDTKTQFDLLADLDSTVCCEEKDCSNEAVWIRRHAACRRLVCPECKEYIVSQMLLCEEDERFWCSVCDTSEPLVYWLDNLKWLPLG